MHLGVYCRRELDLVKVGLKVRSLKCGVLTCAYKYVAVQHLPYTDIKTSENL